MTEAAQSHRFDLTRLLEGEVRQANDDDEESVIRERCVPVVNWRQTRQAALACWSLGAKTGGVEVAGALLD